MFSWFGVTRANIVWHVNQREYCIWWQHSRWYSNRRDHASSQRCEHSWLYSDSSRCELNHRRRECCNSWKKLCLCVGIWHELWCQRNSTIWWTKTTHRWDHILIVEICPTFVVVAIARALIRDPKILLLDEGRMKERKRMIDNTFT